MTYETSSNEATGTFMSDKPSGPDTPAPEKADNLPSDAPEGSLASEGPDILSPEEMEKIPPKIAQLIHSKVVATTGFLPPPEMLREYAEILPDCPERLLTLWENETRHRQEIESRETGLEEQYLEGSIRDSRRGQIFAFVICMAILLAGVYIAHLGHPVTGMLTGITGMASLVYAFRAGRGFSAREAAAKAAKKSMEKEEESATSKEGE